MSRSAAAPIVAGQPDHDLAPGSLECLARSLAELRLQDLDEAALFAARLCLLDCIGAAAAGSRHDSRRRSLEWTSFAFGRGDAPVWFSGERASTIGAAYLNANAASILDLDDGHRAAAGHPGAAVIPGVLAAAEEAKASFGSVLLAIICGYEAGIRIARARDRRLVSGVATGRWSAPAVAAAVAKMFEFTAEESAAAIGIAEPLASNLDAADHEGFIGGDLKEGLPWSVVVGLCAAYQARAGATGYRLALDNASVYREKAFRGATGIETPLLQTVYFKPYACCRWLHSALDGVLDLRAGGISPSAVKSIRVSTFSRAASLPNLADPADIVAAQFSLPFALATAMIEGPLGLMPMEPALIARSDIVELAGKIVIEVDSEFDALFPGQVPARVEVITAAGSASRTVMTPKGDPGNPMDTSELLAKARRLMALAVPPKVAEDICDLVLKADMNSTAPVSALLRALNGVS